MDIGANLTDHQFREDLHQVVDDAFNDGISAIIITGTCVKNSWNALQIVNQFKKKYLDRMYSTVGIHPHNAKDYNETAHKDLETYLKSNSVVAVGECGLDFNRNFSSPEAQINCFRAHIELALKHNLPLFIHERDAFEETIKIFDEYLPKLKEKRIDVVIHCFTGTAEQVKEYVKRGFYIGITGWITDKRRNADLVQALQFIPLDKLMVETDSPYLTPRKAKKRRNEPQFLKYVIEEIAKLLGETEEKIREITINNTLEFFNLPGHIYLPIYEDEECDKSTEITNEKVVKRNTFDENHINKMWGIKEECLSYVQPNKSFSDIAKKDRENQPTDIQSIDTHKKQLGKNYITGNLYKSTITTNMSTPKIDDDNDFPPLGQSK